MNIFIQCALIIIAYMSGVFVIAQIKKDNSLIDVAWALGFVLIAWYTIFYTNLFALRHIVTTLLVTAWGIRLSIHILKRNWKKGPDPRYEELMKKWGNITYIKTFFNIFMLQGLLMWLICITIIWINTSIEPKLFTIFDLVGVCLWLAGFLFETVSDYQLAQFLDDPANKGIILQTGLWRYSRHPNYFGESAIWWGIFIIALATPGGYYTIISPATISYILLFVSLPITEQMFNGNPAYEEYKRKTNAFFPWFAK